MTEPIYDLSNPHVVHIIYPDGLKVPKHMMDPNIGGSYRKANDEEISI